MAHFSKKTIRQTLAPMSRALLNGERPAPIEFMGYRIECRRLYNSPGSLISWSPDFSVIARDADQDRAVMGGKLSEVVAALHRTQTMKRDGFKFIKNEAA